MHQQRRWHAAAVLMAALFFVTSCGGGGGGGGVSAEDTSDDLLLLDLNVADYDGVALNTILEFVFSEDLDPDSVRPETIRVREGPQFGKQVFGHFRVDGDRVFFYPRLPVDDNLETAGFHAGNDYRVYLPSVPKVATVRNYTADRTIRETELYFKTATVDDPDLFIDNFLDPGPPRIINVNPVDGATEVPADATITMTFNRRALDPRTVSADTVKLTMVERKGFPNVRSISGKPVLTQSLESVQVVFQPDFPLPDEAVFELTVSNRVEDLVGFSIPSFTSTFTIRDEPPRLGRFRLEFTEQEKVELMEPDETTASWNEITADALSAIFTAAGGSGASGDLLANSDRNLTPFNTPGVDLNQFEDGVYYDVYNFRRFEILPGATVRLQSSTTANPVKVLSVFPMKIDGVLTVSGGRGQNAISYQYASTKALSRQGGTAGPGGTDGVDSYDGTRYTNVPQPVADDCPYGGYGGQSGGSGTYYYSSGSYYYYRSYMGGGGGGGGSRLSGQDGKNANYPTSGYWGRGGSGGLGRTGNFEREPNVGGAGA
ncbi:MAG: hypothetical protein GF328_07105, partial [Candidatus Latescibacteria bacterium]|nr:hypothetical protein [Candidatus Latescibacterota bacterium]